MVGRDIERVLGDARPPRRADRAVVLALFRRLLVPILAVANTAAADAVGGAFAELVHQVRAAVLRDVVFQGRAVVVRVNVGVDDGIVEAGADRGRRGGLVVDECRHGFWSPQDSDALAGETLLYYGRRALGNTPPGGRLGDPMAEQTRYFPERFKIASQFYTTGRPTYPKLLSRRVAAAVGIGSADSVLDLGTGPGFLAIDFAPLVRSVTALDPAPEML